MPIDGIGAYFNEIAAEIEASRHFQHLGAGGDVGALGIAEQARDGQGVEGVRFVLIGVPLA
jgi:hypothetical protein